MRNCNEKVLTKKAMVAERERLRAAGKTVVFTNGCFDILHSGHISYLDFSRRQGDVLVLGMNSDASVRRNKGEDRPINCEQDRGQVLAALECIDYVVLFDEDEPATLVDALRPDVVVKGEDWAHYVSGREAVEAAGGRVVLAKMVEGRSTTGTIEKVLEVYGGKNEH
jgi:D-beta-D-heptose 7-phosphate kinase/D-beta-D-heptose 1-phosphate adenosyltransferase